MTAKSKFCSQCGVEALPGAAYCVSCGTALGGSAATRVAKTPDADSTRRFAPLIVVAVLLGVCGLAVGLGYRNQPPPNKPLARGGAPALDGEQQLPGDHPPIEVPENVREVIERMESLAAESPEDIEAWKQLAFVQYRAGQFDRTYLDGAEASYRHILDRDEKNIDALRGLGNVAYDRNDPVKAMEYYQRFLEIDPGNKEVRTDLGTMLLASQRPEEAIRTYQGVLQEDPTFFQAQFNLAIAYRAAGQGELAIAALNRAQEVAPDDESRQRVGALLEHVQGGGQAAAGAPEGTLRDAVEAVFRSHPIVGPRIDSFHWDSDQHAQVTLREFPMQGMPPMVREKFVERLTSGIRDSKQRFDFSEPISIDVVDAGSGDTMITIAD